MLGSNELLIGFTTLPYLRTSPGWDEDDMKVGSLVRLKDPGDWPANQCGIVIGWQGVEFRFEHEPESGEPCPVVFWNEKFPSEVEYAHQLEVISATNG